MKLLYNMLRTAARTAFVLACTALLASSVYAQELPLGSSLPSVSGLQNVEGGGAQLSELAGESGTVVIFWSNQCPWIDKYEDRVTALADEYQSQGLPFVLINSNDATAFPKESAEASQERASGYPMTYLRDNGSAAAQAFGASRTPHVFVFDGNNSLVYVGAIDDSPGDPSSVGETYLADALGALASGSEVPVAQTKAFGCMIKQ